MKKILAVLSVLAIVLAFTANVRAEDAKPLKKVYAGVEFVVDEDGYIQDVEANKGKWNEDVAKAIAKEEEIELTDEHWVIIKFLREYYQEYKISPTNRVLTKAISKKLGPDKGNNKYLFGLFPYGPSKQADRISGMPRPADAM